MGEGGTRSVTDEVFVGLISSSSTTAWSPFSRRRRPVLIQLIFKPEIIRDHRDEFRIRGLSTIVLDGVPKVTIQRIHVAAVPRDLDGVADFINNSLGSS